MNSIEREWEAALAHWREDDMARALVPQPKDSDYLTNDVLGMSREPAVCQASSITALEHGVGSRASRLLGGEHPVIARAEEAAAKWIGTESGLLFASGYQANLGLLSTLPDPGDALLSDEWNHASLIDGARLGRASVSVYKHKDLADLEAKLLTTAHAKRRWVVTESVFSMDGDIAPIGGIAELCRKYKASLIVDEAHAAGLIGPAGRGVCADLAGIQDILAARVVTGGKALGVAGAFVLGSAALRAYLIHRARSFVFSTGVTLPTAAALTASILEMPGMDDRRQRVMEGARALASRLDLCEPESAIVPIPCGTKARALELAGALRGQNLPLYAVRPPTVPVGTSRVRVVVHHDWNADDLDRIATTTANLQTTKNIEAAPQKRSIQKPWFVIGTDTDVGKTVASALLLHAAAQNGSASYWKPIQAGLPADTDTVARLTDGLPVTLHPSGFFLSLPKSPDQAAAIEGRRIVPSRIDQQLQAHCIEASGALIVETAGGLFVPWNEQFQTADWVQAVRPRIILVTRSGLGTLNHTQLTLNALHKMRLEPKAVLVMGPPHRDNFEFIRTKVTCPVLQVPMLDPLGSDTLARLAQNLDFNWLKSGAPA